MKSIEQVKSGKLRFQDYPVSSITYILAAEFKFVFNTKLFAALKSTNKITVNANNPKEKRKGG